MKVLVAAATRHGSTNEVAHAMAESFTANGVRADVVTGDAVGKVSDLEGYDAVVLGSAIYKGHWLDAMLTFAQAHAETLARVPVWLFSSGPVGDPTLVRLPAELDPISTATQAREHKVFPGRIALEELDDDERAYVESVGGQTGDYRDWAAVRGYAARIARELTNA